MDAKEELKKVLGNSLYDFMGVEIQKDGSEMFYTMDMDIILNPLTDLVHGLLTLDPTTKTQWKLAPDREPLELQVPENIQFIIKALRKGT